MKRIWQRIKKRAINDEISIIASIRQEIKNQIWKIKRHLRIGLRKVKTLLQKFPYYKLILLLLIPFIAIALYLLYINWISAPDFLELAKTITITGKDKLDILEIKSQISRNRGWFVWMFFSIFGLSIICWVFLLNISIHMKFPIIWFILVAISSTAIYFFLWEWVSNFYGLSKKPIQGEERHSQIVRNLGWILWMIISFLGLSIGLWLAIWGRQIQHKSHLQERYEKAAAMLGNEVLPVRVAGCRALMSLGKENKSMKVQCIRLLFSFINDPYLKPEHQGKNIYRVFPIDEPLRDDIQSAINSFSAIYDHYGDEGIDGEGTILPFYFWKNCLKGPISIIKANLYGSILRGADLNGMNLQGSDLMMAELQGVDLGGVNLRGANLQRTKFQRANLESADLRGANLQGANLQGACLCNGDVQGANLSYANLRDINAGWVSFIKIPASKVNFKGANFSEADISSAEMKDAENLTKGQILSAKWGIDDMGEGKPPSLSEKLENDSEVQKWLATPHYNKIEGKSEFEAAILIKIAREEAKRQRVNEGW